MKRQLTGNSQFATHTAWSLPLHTEGVPRADNQELTHDATAQVCVRVKRSARSGPLRTTLLELIQAVNEVIDDEQLVVATIAYLVNTHRVRLTGTFKNTTLVII